MKSILSKSKHWIAVFVIALLSILSSTSCASEDENAIETRAKVFAQNYFNLRYEAAMNMCTDESKKWITFRASNISQDDIDVINNQTDTAECEIEDINYETDSIASVRIKICNALICDSIGKKGKIVNSTIKNLRMKMQLGTWYADLTQPL